MRFTPKALFTSYAKASVMETVDKDIKLRGLSWVWESSVLVLLGELFSIDLQAGGMCPNALHYFSVIIASSHAAKLLMGTIQYKQVDTHTHTQTHGLHSRSSQVLFHTQEVPAHTCSHHGKHLWLFGWWSEEDLDRQVILN